MRGMRAERITSVVVIGVVAVIAAGSSGTGSLRLQAHSTGDHADSTSQPSLQGPQSDFERDQELLRIADPANQTFYPPARIADRLPPRSAQRFTLGWHALLATWGMYRLLRDFRLTRWAALFGAVAFGLSGSLGSGPCRLELWPAAAWIPCVFWRLRRTGAGRPRSTLVLGDSGLRVAGVCGAAGHRRVDGPGNVDLDLCGHKTIGNTAAALGHGVGVCGGAVRRAGTAVARIALDDRE